MPSRRILIPFTAESPKTGKRNATSSVNTLQKLIGHRTACTHSLAYAICYAKQ